jgi:hypothetical protein
MSATDLFGLVVCVAVLLYLLYALLRGIFRAERLPLSLVGLESRSTMSASSC